MSSAKMKNLLFVMVILVLGGVLAACTPTQSTTGQAPAAALPADGGQITVIGHGEAFGRPDEAQAQVGVETFAATVEAATSENQAVIDRIMATLDELGIAEEDIQTSQYSLWAEQRYGDNGPEGISGYRVVNQVGIKIRDINQVSDVLAAVTEAGANSINGVYFSVSEPAELQAAAREKAIADARARAESLAQLSGLTLGEIKVVSEVIGQAPLPLGMGGGGMAYAEAAAAPSISPGQLSYQLDVLVTFATE